MNLIKELIRFLTVNDAPSTDSCPKRPTEIAAPFPSNELKPPIPTHTIRPPERANMVIRTEIYRKTTIDVTTNGLAFRGKQTKAELSEEQMGILKRDGYRHGRVNGIEIRWKEDEYRYFELKRPPESLRDRVGLCGSDNGAWYRIHVTTCEIKTFHQAVELARTGLRGNVEHT